MENFAESISLQYGNAEVSFYNIKITPKSEVKMQWHRHRYYELHLAVEGSFSYRFHDGIVTLDAGQMLIIPPDVEHFSVDVTNGHKINVVSMSITEIDNEQKFYSALTEALNKNACHPIAFSYSDVKVFEYTELYRSVLGVLKLKQIAACFVEHLFTLLLSNNNPQIASGKALAVLIDTLVNRDGTSLSEIAAATNYSKRHVTRLIKKTYGMPLSEMKRRQKEKTK